MPAVSVLPLPVPVPATDSALLERIAAGDRAALDDLFRRYRSVAYRVAYRLLGREADALDAVQDGFVKALTNLERFRGHSSFKTWLLRIVSNAALDLGRQRKRDARLPQAPPGDPPDRFGPADLPPPDTELARADLRRRDRRGPRPAARRASGRRSSCTWTADCRTAKWPSRSESRSGP